MTGRREFRAAAAEHGVHGPPVSFRKLGEDLLDHRAEQIIECREGQRRLGRGRTAGQHPVVRPGGPDDVPPHHRLADAGITGDHDRRGCAGRRQQEGADLSDLGLPAGRPWVQAPRRRLR